MEGLEYGVTRPRQVRYLDWDDSLVREVVRGSHMSV
jgi:hypothetical protein